MHLDMKIHPAIAILVVALTVSAIGVKIWADGKATAIGGPAQLFRDPSGHLYIQIQNQLIEHDADGVFIRRHDLGALGVDTVIGAVRFFSDGDLLLRRGPDRRSLGNKIAAYRRAENRTSLTPDAPDAGLVRCDLGTRECVAFTRTAIDLKSTFGMFIDWETDDVLISDTSRHVLRKYSSDGIELAGPIGGFKFPNQLVLYDGKLFVADTNHHRIQIVDPANSSFGYAVESIDVVPEGARRRGELWPSHFARIGDEWWVNNMENDMRNGGVYAFDSRWNFKRRVSLPDEADPIAIMAFGEGALVSDWDNDRVHYIAASGEALADFTSRGLDAVIEESRSARLHYKALSWAGVLVLAPVLIGLLFKAVISPAPPVRNAGPEFHSTASSASNELVWFEPDPKAVRKVMLGLRVAGLSIFAIGLVTVIVAFVYLRSGFVFLLLGLVIALPAIHGLIYWLSRANTRTAIGFQSDDIILRDHRNKESRCPIRKVAYDTTAIVSPDSAVFLGRPNMPLYDRIVLSEQILPRLAAARRVSAWQIQRMLWRQQYTQIFITLIIVAVAVTGFVAILAVESLNII